MSTQQEATEHWGFAPTQGEDGELSAPERAFSLAVFSAGLY